MAVQASMLVRLAAGASQIRIKHMLDGIYKQYCFGLIYILSENDRSYVSRVDVFLSDIKILFSNLKLDTVK